MDQQEEIDKQDTDNNVAHNHNHDENNVDSNIEADKKYEWSAFYDDEGRMYYYNETSGESSWDAPEHYNPPPPPDSESNGEHVEDKDAVVEDKIDQDGDSHNQPSSSPSQQDKPATAADATEGNAKTTDKTAWVAYQDDEGRTYYFNTQTEETTWDKPDGVDPPLVDDTADTEVGKATEGGAPLSPDAAPFDQADSPGNDGLSPVREASPMMSEDQQGFDDNDDDIAMAEKEKEEEEEVIDPAVKRLEEAHAALQQTDAILEPGVMNHVTEVVTSEGGKPLTAIEALSDSYFGQTAACGLMARWLADLKAHSAVNSSGNNSKKATSNSGISAKSTKIEPKNGSINDATKSATDMNAAFVNGANGIRDSVQDVINRLVKERFTKSGGDKILSLSKAEAAFLQEMMVSSRWRKLLIDLSASNKDSALLMYCLEQISKKGHHREIARRINQSDHFSVFHAMLASELSVIGKIAVSNCKDADTSISLSELVEDLKRTCTSTAYTYIYAIEVLRQIIATGKEKAEMDAAFQTSLFARAIRKWERLNEDLQSAIIDPFAASGSTPLFRKRRLDVAVTISELHQRQRRRLAPTSTNRTKLSNSDEGRDKTESAVLEFLRRYSLGTRVDDRILDKMLPDGLSGDKTNLVGRLMIKRPLTVKALLGYLFKPASQRVSGATIRNKCARLIVLAVHAAEGDALAMAKKIDKSLSIEYDEVALSRTILEGSQLCEALENMVSFIVTIPGLNEGSRKSPGQHLCSIATKCAPVAQGTAIWARELTKASEFTTSASYPTLSPSILSLMRVIFLEHPFIRNEVMDVALGFLTHSNSEISYQKMNEIKEQSLRLLLFLCTRGEALVVLGQMIKFLKGKIHVDASLVRYFISGLLEIAHVPFSIPFIRLLCKLLKVSATVEAIKTAYFDGQSKMNLNRVVRYIGGLESNGTHGKLSQEDVNLFRSTVLIYDVGK